MKHVPSVITLAAHGRLHTEMRTCRRILTDLKAMNDWPKTQAGAVPRRSTPESSGNRCPLSWKAVLISWWSIRSTASGVPERKTDVHDATWIADLFPQSLLMRTLSPTGLAARAVHYDPLPGYPGDDRAGLVTH